MLRRTAFFLVLSLCIMHTLAFAQTYLVLDANRAKFGWDIAPPLAPGESYEMRCLGQGTTPSIVIGGILSMPLPFSSVFGGQTGQWTCQMFGISTTGTPSPTGSNIIGVKISGSKLIIEY